MTAEAENEKPKKAEQKRVYLLTASIPGTCLNLTFL